MAALCLKLGLHEYLQDTTTIIHISSLCDIVESIIGAIYEDGDTQAVQDFVLKYFLPMLNKAYLIMTPNIIKDASKKLNLDVIYTWSGNICTLVKSIGKGIVTNVKVTTDKASIKRLSRYLAEKEFVKNQLPIDYQKSLVILATDPDYHPLDVIPELNLSWSEVLKENFRVRLHTLMQKLGNDLPSYNFQEDESENGNFICKLNSNALKDIIGSNSSKSKAAEIVATKAYFQIQKSIIFYEKLKNINDEVNNLDINDPISSLNLFCQAYGLELPTYTNYFKEKNGEMAFYTCMDSPWLITSIKGSTKLTSSEAKTEVAKRVIALIKHFSIKYLEPKKLYMMFKCKEALSVAEPINMLIHSCQCLDLELKAQADDFYFAIDVVIAKAIKTAK